MLSRVVDTEQLTALCSENWAIHGLR